MKDIPYAKVMPPHFPTTEVDFHFYQVLTFPTRDPKSLILDGDS